MKHYWLISYDVRDAKRLRKVAKFLEGYGERLQYSVFTVYVTDRDLQKIKWDLTKKLEKEDSVYYFIDFTTTNFLETCLFSFTDCRTDSISTKCRELNFMIVF